MSFIRHVQHVMLYVYVQYQTAVQLCAQPLRRCPGSIRCRTRRVGSLGTGFFNIENTYTRIICISRMTVHLVKNMHWGPEHSTVIFFCVLVFFVCLFEGFFCFPSFSLFQNVYSLWVLQDNILPLEIVLK